MTSSMHPLAALELEEQKKARETDLESIKKAAKAFNKKIKDDDNSGN